MANIASISQLVKVESFDNLIVSNTLANIVVYSNGMKMHQPGHGNNNLYGVSTVGGGAPQPPPSTSTGSGQIFPTGRQ